MTMAPFRPPLVKSEPRSDTESSTGRSDEILLADNFPSKTFLVIEACDSDDPDVACWSDDGTYFVVKNTAVFAASHLPCYFKHSNFQSFVRQLNIYGWRTVKQSNCADGSVAFHHKFFQRGRRDLLGNIKRSKKASRNPNVQDKKKDDEYSTFNSRFDEIQEQMDTLSDKLDLLISLVSARSDKVVSRDHAGSKRRRRDSRDSHASPVSDMTDTTEDSDEEGHHGYSGAVAPAPVPPPPPFALDMAVADEVIEALANASGTRYGKDYRDLLELRESSSRDLNEQHHAASYNARAAPDDQGEEAMEDDDFRLFIDKMLDGDQQDLGRNSEHGTQGTMEEDIDSSNHGTNNGSNTFVADPLMTKVHPETVQASIHIPQMTATAIEEVHSNEEYDEEAGDYASSPPFTTAVAVTDDESTASQKRSRRRTKVFFAIAALLLLTAFVVWPLVTLTGKKSKTTKKDQYDRYRGSRSGSRSGRSGSNNDFDEHEWASPPPHHGRKGSDSSDSGPADESDPSGQGVMPANGTWNNNVFTNGDESEDQDEDESEDRAEDSGDSHERPKPFTKAHAPLAPQLTLGWNGDSYQCVMVQRTP